MPITIFGETTCTVKQPQIHQIPHSKTLPDLSSFVTKDQAHDKKYLNKNFIKRDVIGTTSSFITLNNQRRIAGIKPGIDPNDTMNKKQIEDHVANYYSQVLKVIKLSIKEAKDECTKISEDIISRERRSRDADITSVIYFNGTLSNNILCLQVASDFFLFYVTAQL